MRYAIVKGGKVVNVILWDGESAYPVEGELVALGDAPCGPDWDYSDGEFTAPFEASETPPNGDVSPPLARSKSDGAIYEVWVDGSSNVVALPVPAEG